MGGGGEPIGRVASLTVERADGLSVRMVGGPGRTRTLPDRGDMRDQTHFHGLARGITRTLLAGVLASALGGVAGCSLLSSSRGEEPVVYASPEKAANGEASNANAAAPAEMARPLGVMPTASASPALAGPDRPARRGATDGALRQHTFAGEGGDFDVALDPSGHWMAFTSTRHSEHPKLYLQRVDGVTVTQLTTDAGDDAQPAFSPDGRRIAFASNRHGAWSIYMMDVDGKNLVQLTNVIGVKSQDLRPSWSPDGNAIAYCSMTGRGKPSAGTGNWEIWIVDVTTGSKRVIGEGMFPAWSPDKSASRLAFQKARERGDRMYSIWTVDLDPSGEPRRWTEVAWAADRALVTPTWSPDGKKLAYAAVEQKPGGAADASEIWTVNADGTDRRRIISGSGVANSGMALSPTFSATGELFFISDRSGSEGIWSVKPSSDLAVALDPGVKPRTAHAEASGHSEATEPEAAKEPSMGAGAPRANGEAAGGQEMKREEMKPKEAARPAPGPAAPSASAEPVTPPNAQASEPDAENKPADHKETAHAE